MTIHFVHIIIHVDIHCTMSCIMKSFNNFQVELLERMFSQIQLILPY